MFRLDNARTVILTLTASLMLPASVAVAQCGGSSARATSASGNDIVATAVSAGSFNSLVAAAKAAGLVDALQSDGPLTVFAPTDEAFGKLPAGTVEKLLKPENRAQLRAILTYHVVPGSVKAKDVVKSAGAKTLNGQRLDFSTKSGKVRIDEATVITADIACSNGVIHVIDAVMLPADSNIVATAQSTEMFNTLLTAATKAGLAETLSDGGPFTVFAPTDDAFGKLPKGTVEELLKPENRDKLATILKYHVVQGRVYSSDAIAAGKADTLAGQKVTIREDGTNVRVDDALVLKADVDASNGVIHVIDRVILPG